ncbi:MAG: N-acetyl-lysine deacetylase [Thermoprotei archaeon]
MLLDLVSVYTPSGEEYKAKDVLSRIASRLGLAYSMDETGSHFLGNPNSRVLLASHIDTVPGFIPPLDDGTAIHGRGAVDAKGPLSAMIVAASLMKEEGCEVLVAGLSDEEGFSRGAKTLAISGKKFDYVVIGEPTSTTGIAIEYRGVIHVDVKCRSSGGHSSSVKGNVIEEVAKRLIQVYSPPSEYDKPSINPTIFRSGTAINVVPEEAYVHFDIRYSSKNDPEEILKLLRNAFEGCNVELTEHLPPVKTSVNSTLFKAFSRALISQGLKPSPVRKWGTSDMNVLAPIAKEILAYGPGDSRLEHTDKERITYDELYIGTVTYYTAVKELCRNYRA